MHASEPRSCPTQFYVFEDTTSPHILLSYATSERQGIITFNVPNLAATSWVDNIDVPTPYPKVAWGRLLKQSVCRTPHRDQQTTLQCPSPYLPQQHEKTDSLQVSFGKPTNINGSKCKSPTNHCNIHTKAYPYTSPLFQGPKPPNIHLQGTFA